MPRILVTALSAVTMVGVGIVALQYRAQDLGEAGLTGANASAYNLTTSVSTDMATIAGAALPRLFALVIVVLAIVMILMNR